LIRQTIHDANRSNLPAVSEAVQFDGALISLIVFSIGFLPLAALSKHTFSFWHAMR
jgi:hypothetical protein